MIDLTISPLTVSEAHLISDLLYSAKKTYSKYFIPFQCDIETITRIFSAAVKDRYWGVYSHNEIVGFFMLRGLDQGYNRPSFVVYISEAYSNKGLSKLALYYSISWCRLNNISALMLKVHPENIYAKRSYEKAGFSFIEICKNTGHEMMEISL